VCKISHVEALSLQHSDMSTGQNQQAIHRSREISEPLSCSSIDLQSCKGHREISLTFKVPHLAGISGQSSAIFFNFFFFCGKKGNTIKHLVYI